MNKISKYLKLVTNIIGCIFMFNIPNVLTNTIQEAGYSGEMFTSIFIVKTAVYTLIILIIMISINVFCSSFEKNN